MSDSSEFHDLLFEMSNEDRYEILMTIQKQKKRITELTRQMGLTSTEVRRHVSRLTKAGLIHRDVDGYYHLTPYGESSLILLQDITFLSAKREYFETHTLSRVPPRFIKRISELRADVSLANPLDFVRHTENLLKETKEYVWLLVDQFPMNSLSTIMESLNRGVKLRIIEPRERVLNPDLEAVSAEESEALARTRGTPLVEQRMLNQVDVLLFLSEARAVLSFPLSDGQHDYRGFAETQGSALDWCRGLFLHYWDKAERRTATPVTKIRRGLVSTELVKSEQITVVGQENPVIDAQAVQDAVDNYDEVILKGTFNFGSSMVQILRSVALRGEGQDKSVPSTTIYKKNWRFPFEEFDAVFKVDGEGANVKIENINFTDFNHTCIWVRRCRSLSVRNNRITLMTGYGRGQKFGAFGDVIIGVFIMPEPYILRGKVAIEDNFIDFARTAWGGALSRNGLEEDPAFRPNLLNHEYYMSFGVAVHQTSGTVNIEKNVIRNANARGIAATGNLETADIRIAHNTIESDVYGSYPFSSPEAGAGVLVQSAWEFPSPGFNVDIRDNTIKLDKLNYTGIKVLGPVMDRKGADKLRGGVIRENRIYLKNGYEGIHVRKCDDFELSGNTISGEAYYGIRVSGRRKSGEQDLSSLNNLVEDNDMGGLRVKEPDDYSDSHAAGRMFAGTPGASATAHVWLDLNSMKNEVRLREGETVINENKENRITFSPKT